MNLRTLITGLAANTLLITIPAAMASASEFAGDAFYRGDLPINACIPFVSERLALRGYQNLSNDSRTVSGEKADSALSVEVICHEYATESENIGSWIIIYVLSTSTEDHVVHERSILRDILKSPLIEPLP